MDENFEIDIQDEHKERRDYFLPMSILTAAVLISGSILYAVGRQDLSRKTNPGAAVGSPGTPTGKMEISARDVILGDPKAPVTLIEYGDYQCPFCGHFFTETEPLLREQYIKTNKVRMVFRNFQFLGPESTAAAAAAECAKDQRQFWNYHDALYRAEVQDGKERNGNLNRGLFLKIAGDLKLDTNAFTNCIDIQKYTTFIEKDRADAQALGVNSTPTTFVNSQKIVGAEPFTAFKTLIDEELKTK